MRNNDPRQPLSDAIESIEKIHTYFNHKSLKDLEENDLLFDAIAMRLQVIGESVNKIPQELKELYPKTPWNEIVALRNYISHAYSYLDAKRFYMIIKEDLSLVEKNLRSLFELSLKKYTD